MKPFGLSGIKGRETALWFDLEPMDTYSDWKGRLVVKWPPGRLWWRWACARGGGRKIVAFQQLQRMTETDAFGPLHPLDHVAAFAAGSLAAPNIFHRVDIEARIGVFVERAQPDQFFAAAPAT
jgi:hypothetical protein